MLLLLSVTPTLTTALSGNSNTVLRIISLSHQALRLLLMDRKEKVITKEKRKRSWRGKMRYIEA